MKKINLRELYPGVYPTDLFIDVTEEVMETIRAAERADFLIIFFKLKHEVKKNILSANNAYLEFPLFVNILLSLIHYPIFYILFLLLNIEGYHL